MVHPESHHLDDPWEDLEDLEDLEDPKDLVDHLEDHHLEAHHLESHQMEDHHLEEHHLKDHHHHLLLLEALPLEDHLPQVAHHLMDLRVTNNLIN